jgi:hypothetical protein
MKWTLIIAVLLPALAASGDLEAQGPPRDGVITLSRGTDNSCQTSTTPYIRARPPRVVWRIDDKAGCLGKSQVSLRFPKGPLLICDGLSGTTTIECDLRKIGKPVAATKYDVLLDKWVEDPELEIEM